MISNQILQNTIEGLKAITRIDLCVMDIEGKVLASTFSNAEDYEKFVLEFVNSPADSQVLQGFQFLMSISWSLLFWQEETVMMSI